jgi:BirA family biotin operon repressor/biotin-[acetyl-CoA-carboxylase] ligase
VSVKWPNDLLVGGRKLGGILVEQVGGCVVVGVGVNVAPPVGGFSEELGPLVTTLETETDKRLPINALARGVAHAILDRLDRPGAVARAIEDLKTRDALAGRLVQTEHQGAGVAVGVDSTGALLLERPDGTRVSVVSGRVRLQS